MSLARMMVMTHGTNDNRVDRRYNTPRDDYNRGGNYNSPRSEYNDNYMPRSYGNPLQYDYGMDTENNIYDAFRDSRGRRHYDNGRYAPMRSYYDDGSGSDMDRNNEGEYYPGGITMNYGNSGQKAGRESHKMGFAAGNEKMDKHTAEEWVHQMRNEDGTSGPHWNMEQAKQIMQQNGIDCEPAEFYAALNMMYSDYCKVAKKYGVNESGYYAHLAKAFLDDKDAGDGKLMRYYECVVK